MLRSVKDVMNTYKTCIMNNFVSGEHCSIPEIHAQLLAEIKASDVSQEEKEICLQNIERAYMKFRQDLFGREEEEWKLK